MSEKTSEKMSEKEEKKNDKHLRGFATLRQTDPIRHREIASAGGKAAHAKGTAHEWNSEQARAAALKPRISKKVH